MAKRKKRNVLTEPIPTWWMSFTDDTGFLGVILVDAPTLEDAVTQTHLAGCNPGGHIAAVPMPALSTVPKRSRAEATRTYALPRLTLLSKDDLQKATEIVRRGDLPEGHPWR